MKRVDTDDAYFILILIAVAAFVFFSVVWSPQFPRQESHVEQNIPTVIEAAETNTVQK